LLLCTVIAADGSVLKVQKPSEPGNPVTALHFGVNSEFSRPGIFAGTLPGDDPRSKTDAFAAALHNSGIRVLRFPGGDSSYFYLPEGKAATMQLAHALGLGEYSDDNPGSRQFVTLDNLASFAKKHDIGLIYQLPLLFHFDGQRAHAAIRSVFSTTAKNYDVDRIEAQAAYAGRIVGRLRALETPVVAWELGNEEWAHCNGTDYARVAAAIVREIRRQDKRTPIVAVGMGDAWLTECVGELRQQGVLDQIQSFNVHYPFGAWPGPATPGDGANLQTFAQGDLQITRWFDAAAKQRADLLRPTLPMNRSAAREPANPAGTAVFAMKDGPLTTSASINIPAAPMAVTETMVFKFDKGYWDSLRVIGTHAHALLYAWNWMAMLADPRCNMAVFHDLETPFFGMLRYDVGYDETARQFTWLAATKAEQKLRRFPEQYVLSPTSAANRLLSEVVGCRAGLARTNPDDPNVRILWGVDAAGRSLAVAVHRSPERKRLAFPGYKVESAQSLTADNLESVLPGQYRVAALSVDPSRRDQVELPPWSVSLIRFGGGPD
jgi:hypothetical protein